MTKLGFHTQGIVEKPKMCITRIENTGNEIYQEASCGNHAIPASWTT